MLVKVVQSDINLGDKKVNLRKAIKLIKKSRADLFLFPEVFTTGMDLEHVKEHAESLNGETIKKLKEHSRKKIIAGSLMEEYRGRIYNTLVLLEDKQLRGFYRKIHLFQKENEYFTAGDMVEVVETKHGRMGLSICYDLRFPELYRKQTDEGAGVLMVCANFPRKRIEHWRTLLKARAIENQAYVVGCNRTGSDGINEYNGKSMVIDPWGEVLAEAGQEEQTLEVEVDPGEVERIRRDFPVLEDRKLGVRETL
ncbi:MAG: carbon-nitrogen hydrolase [Candidatus Altiarchaeales archaeon ex4484_2]|nr:MAG: carbon-nitrogen hydrolase [Candidatus Altiarchaeales archaeon ex4484_2]